MIDVNKIVASNKVESRTVGMHYSAGSGHTDTMLAAFLLYENIKMTADEAIEETWKIRKKNKGIHNDGDKDVDEDNEEENDEDDDTGSSTNTIEVLCHEEVLDTYCFF